MSIILEMEKRAANLTRAADSFLEKGEVSPEGIASILRIGIQLQAEQILGRVAISGDFPEVKRLEKVARGLIELKFKLPEK